MLKVAHGSANWLVIPISFAILLFGLGATPGWEWLQSLSFVPFFLFLAFWFFFRDPDRGIATGVVCPADGRVVSITQHDDPDIGPADRLSIFMRPQDVHVNRFPFDGDVRRVKHHAGKHVPAFSKDSDRNERVETIMRTAIGDVKVVQIAGAVARRIVPYSKPGDHVKAGEKLGLIRLGSRCDLYVPRGTVAWHVEPKQRVMAAIMSVGDVATSPEEE